MYIKGLIVVIILFFYFDWVHAMFGSSSKSQVNIDWQFISSRSMINNQIHEICNAKYPVTCWATYCLEAIKFLKETYSEYRNSIYLNYHRFTTMKATMCIPQTLLVPQVFESNRIEIIDQPMIQCFCRSAVEPYKLPEDHYKLANEIAIYPSLIGNYWSIFKYNPRGFYTFHSWFPMVLRNIEIVPRGLLDVPPPQSIADGALLFHILRKIMETKKSNPMFQEPNVINLLNQRKFVRLCHVLYGREEYANEVMLPTTTQPYQYLNKGDPKPFHLFIFVQGIKIKETDTLNGYECELYNRTNGELTLDYKILPGLERTTVLLAQKIEQHDSCLVRESIVNVNLAYFDELF